jgi:hypothetical protein
MTKDKMDFLKPGCPFIIIRKLTFEIIEKAIQVHLKNDAYWLKLHHFAANI